MKYAQLVVRILSPLFFLCAAVLPLGAQADEYSEVMQLTRDGKYTEAMNKADAYLAGRPRDPQMRFLKGVAQKDAGKNSDAITTFSKLTEEFPELPEPYNNLAVLYANQNQFDKAKSALEMALKTNPGYAIAYENLGDVYAKLSSQAYNKALQIEGTNPAISPKLALVRQLFNSSNGRLAPLATSTGPASDKAAPAASSKPAAAPVVVPAPAPSPAAPAAVSTPPGKAEEIQNQGSSKAVEDAVQNWAEAWSGKNLKAYFASYAKDFDPPGGAKRSAWEDERQTRIMGKSKISVRLEGLKITVSGNKAIAKFRQDYKADGLTVSSRKTLELIKHGERWQITRETVGA
jgi:tetratricopeptide (TPR) repeat protein